jgi:ferric-dicitrate binding protein FerR (iron transport regulator)
MRAAKLRHMANSRRKRPSKSRLLLRWAAVGAFCVVAVLYYRPARTYLHTRHTVAARAAEVRTLRRQHEHLQRLVAASTSDVELAREARRLGLVKPGERLFIVKGINRWLKRHADN